MGDKYAVFFAPKAHKDLEETLKYIAEDLCNPKAASDLTKKLFDKLDTIRAFPGVGAKIENEYIFDQSLRKFHIDNYIAFYKTDEENKRIIVVRILYGRRNVDEARFRE